MDMEAMKEKINNMMEKAELDAAVYFGKCLVMAAKLETGEILLEAHMAESAEAFDEEQATAGCIQSMWERLWARETMTPDAPVEMTQEQAEIIVAMAENNLNMTAAGKRLGKSAGSVKQQVAKIKEATGLDPQRFFDMCQLLVVANTVLSVEE